NCRSPDKRGRHRPLLRDSSQLRSIRALAVMNLHIFEGCCQAFSGTRQQSALEAHGHKYCTVIQPATAQLGIGVQDARRLTSLDDALDGVVDGCLYLGMTGITDVPHGSRKIGRPDENAIDALYRSNFF